jgi:hypothetical protein
MFTFGSDILATRAEVIIDGLVLCAGPGFGPVSGLGEHHHPGQQDADAQLPLAHPAASRASIRGAAPEAPVISSIRASGMLTGSRPAARPRRHHRPVQRGEQVAQPLGAGDPGHVHERGQPSNRAESASQVDRSREISGRGGPVPPDSDRATGVVTFLRAGSRPPVTARR